VEGLVTLTWVSDEDEAFQKVSPIKAKIVMYLDQVGIFNRHKKLFGFPGTTLPNLAVIQKTFYPSSQLWRRADQMRKNNEELIEGPSLKDEPIRHRGEDEHVEQAHPHILPQLIFFSSFSLLIFSLFFSFQEIFHFFFSSSFLL
jgi:hypothetical protein